MNYKYFCKEEWDSLLNTMKGYTFGQCMFAILSCGGIKDRKELLGMTDEQMHKLIIKTVKKEKDEQ